MGGHTGDQAVAVKVFGLPGFEKHVGFVDEQDASPSAGQGKVGLQTAFDDLGGGSQVSCRGVSVARTEMEVNAEM